MFVFWQCVDLKALGEAAQEVGLAGLLAPLGEWDVTPVRDWLREALGAGCSRENVEITIEVPRRGERCLVLNALRLGRDDEAAASMILTIEDVTDRRQAEQSLKAAEAHFRQLVEHTDRRNAQFLATLAHELRNPLAPIVAGLRVLQSDTGDAQQARALAVLDRQVRHMARLIEDLIDLTRLTRGSVVLRRDQVDLVSMVDASLELVRAKIQAAGQSLTVTLPSDVVCFNGDPLRLSQVLTNLLSNASQFTRSGGQISLAIERDGPEVVIRVQDSGSGISADRLPYVFESFLDPDAGKRQPADGLGVGLVIVRLLVEQHGGTVSAASPGLGQGSEFVVRLPCVLEVEHPGVSPEADASGNGAASRADVQPDGSRVARGH